MKEEFEKNKKKMTKYVEKAYIEGRIKALEAMVKVALSK